MPLTKEQIDEFMQSRWVVIPVLDVPDLIPPAAMFAFLDQDLPDRPGYLGFQLFNGHPHSS